MVQGLLGSHLCSALVSVCMGMVQRPAWSYLCSALLSVCIDDNKYCLVLTYVLPHCQCVYGNKACLVLTYVVPGTLPAPSPVWL